MTKCTRTIRFSSRSLLLTIGIALSLASAGFATPEQGHKAAGEEHKPNQVISIDDAIRTAIQNSKPLRMAAQQVSLQQGVVAERRAGFNPGITASATATRFDEATTAQLGGNSLTLQKDTQSEVGISASLPLDISGQIQTSVSQAQLEEIAVRLAYNAARNNLVAAVKADYHAVLRAKSLVEVAQSDLVNAEQRLSTANSKLRQGVVPQFDVIRAQTDVTAAKENLIQARSNVELALAQLRRTLGLEQAVQIEVGPTETQPVADYSEPALLAEARRARPEILQADTEIKASERGIKLARSSYEPTFALSFGYAYSPDAAGFSPRTNAWQAQAGLKIPLFDRGIAAARTSQARSGVALARTQRADTDERVALDVRQAMLNYVNAGERIPVATAALTQAREGYRLARVRFETGVSTTPGGAPLLELTDAQSALTAAQTNLVNAQYDLLTARANLDRAAGRYAYGEKPGVSGPSAIRK